MVDNVRGKLRKFCSHATLEANSSGAFFHISGKRQRTAFCKCSARSENTSNADYNNGIKSEETLTSIGKRKSNSEQATFEIL